MTLMSSDQSRTYDREQCVTFLKTNTHFGALSNMAGGFPLSVSGIKIRTSEALYQACRFPHLPDVQRLIIEQRSPMTAKMKSKPYRKNSRQDWDQVRVKIMRWCLRVKLAQNWQTFSSLLLETGDRPIVEESRKDAFWGANPIDRRSLVGRNVLGRLLMELREVIKAQNENTLLEVTPVAIPDFLLGGRPIGMVTGQNANIASPGKLSGRSSHDDAVKQEAVHSLPFESPSVEDLPLSKNFDKYFKTFQAIDLKPYPEYKESGLPWLGKVPKHWSFRRIKTLLHETDCRSIDGLGTLLSLTRVRGLIPHQQMTNKMHSAKTLVGYKRYRAGQVVMNRMQAWSGMFGAGSIDGLVSPDYAVFDVLGGNAFKIVLERLKTPDLVAQFALESKGIGSGFNRLYTDRFGAISISLPPLDEQGTIVHFLDWVSGRLERAIRAKRKVIALLNEQKQTIVHRAVTRGLNPSIPLKPSGIPWLGEVPQHWKLLRSKYAFREIDVRSATGKETHLSMSQKLGLIPSSQIKEKRLVSESYKGAKLCEKNDLVLNRLKAHLGVFALALEPGLVSPDYTVLRPVRELETRFFEAVYRTPACRSELRQRAKGIVQGFWRLYTDDFYDIRVPVPPVDEQKRIMTQLDIDLSELNIAISRLEREIELLREYRIRLLADVVTGKLDVREVASILPNKATPDIDEDESDLSFDSDPVDDEVTV